MNQESQDRDFSLYHPGRPKPPKTDIIMADQPA